MRRVLAWRSSLAVAMVALLSAWPANADRIEVCASASEDAQVLRDEGALRQAREKLVTCAAEECPSIVVEDCQRWLAEVDAAMPTLVLSVVDAEGKDVVGGEISIDGELRRDVELGRAFAIDPGTREVEVRLADGRRAARPIVVRQGEKGRTETLSLPAQQASEGPLEQEDDPGGLRVPLGAWILLGVAAVGGGAFIGMSAYADGEVEEMRTTCAPNCDPGRVDEARGVLIGGNIALALGIAALGGAVAWTVFESSSSDAAVSVHPFGVGGVF